MRLSKAISLIGKVVVNMQEIRANFPEFHSPLEAAERKLLFVAKELRKKATKL